jgi:hypothetical protein
MLFALFERAYIARTLSQEILTQQWPGWEAYIRDYLFCKPSLREEWVAKSEAAPTGHGLDLRFQVFMDEIIANNGGVQKF